MKKSFLAAAKKAKVWTDCYPLGNGNIGAMDNGDPKRNIVYLNDDRLWSGHGQKKWRDDGGEGIKKARSQFLEGKKTEAEQTLWDSVCGEFAEAYLPLGELHIDSVPGRIRKYSRVLDMNNALHSVTAKTSVGQWADKSFVSYVDGCYIKEITAEKPTTSKIYLTCKLKHGVFVQNGNILIKGLAPGRVFPSYHSRGGESVVYSELKGQDFAIAATVITDGTQKESEDGITVQGWTRLRIVLVTGVTFMEDDKTSLLLAKLASLSEQTPETLEKRHISAYRPLFDRVNLTINGLEESPKNTEKAIIRYNRGRGEENLVVTEFDFGRYLIIAGSGKGSFATNLQGIWNKEVQAPWSCHHTTNINTQMNYWPAEIVDLHECFTPLVELVKKVARTGAEVAKDTFGMRGWCLNHNTDYWATANPIGGEGNSNPMQYAYFVSGGGWLVNQLYDSYLFNKNDEYLSEIYPLIKGAAEFYLDYLVEYGDYLIPLLSTSPENAYIENGKTLHLDKWTTMEVSIIRGTLKSFAAAAKKLKEDAAMAKQAETAAKKLPPFAVGSDGRLLEYSEEYAEVEKEHRHISHLYAFYPDAQITQNKTPDLVEAVKKSLAARGMYGTGWSLSWKLNVCARLRDKDGCALLMRRFNHLNAGINLFGRGGCYRSTLCAHPPFQIDGNYGFTSGVAEMLLQSHDGEIVLAPCIPDKWTTVKVEGLVARGGKHISYEYKDGKIIGK